MKRRDALKLGAALPIAGILRLDAKAEPKRENIFGKPIEINLCGSCVMGMHLHMMVNTGATKWRMHPGQAWMVFLTGMIIRDSAPEFGVIGGMQNFRGMTIDGAPVEQTVEMDATRIEGYDAKGNLVCLLKHCAVPIGYPVDG